MVQAEALLAIDDFSLDCAGRLCYAFLVGVLQVQGEIVMSGSIWRVPARVYRSNVAEGVLDALDEYYKNPERVVVIEVSANLGAENAEDVIVELGGLMVVPDDDFLL